MLSHEKANSQQGKQMLMKDRGKQKLRKNQYKNELRKTKAKLTKESQIKVWSTIYKAREK